MIRDDAIEIGIIIVKSSEFSICKNGILFSYVLSPSVQRLKKITLWKERLIFETIFWKIGAVIKLKPPKSGLEGKSGAQVDAK